MKKINLKEALASKQPKIGKTLFIALDGHGGSGKSTLADLLSKELNAQIIRLDDFASWDNPLNWWPLVIERVFNPIANGATTLNYPRSKWWENHNPDPVVDQPVTPVIIIEGVSSLRKEFRNYVSLSIFVDTPKDVCLKRGVDRDLNNDTGKTEEEITELWEQWYKDEDTYLERDDPKAYADIVLDGTVPFSKQLDLS